VGGTRRPCAGLARSKDRALPARCRLDGNGVDQGKPALLPLVALHSTRLKLLCSCQAAAGAGAAGAGTEAGALALASRQCFGQAAREAAGKLLQRASNGKAAARQLHAALVEDCVAALRWCQAQYWEPGLLHTASRPLARALLALGRRVPGRGGGWRGCGRLPARHACWHGGRRRKGGLDTARLCKASCVRQHSPMPGGAHTFSKP